MNNKEIVKSILENNDITTFNDFTDVMAEIQGQLLQTILDSELDCHLGYEKSSHGAKEDENRRNGHCEPKEVKTKNGSFKVRTPRDRAGTFEPIIIPKKQTMLDSFEDIAVSCYAKGMSLRDIEALFNDIYKAKFNKDQISHLISKVNVEVEKWKNRPLKKFYPFIYIDCLRVPIKKDMVSINKAVYVMLGIDITGHKEIIGVWIDDNESATFWTNVLEEIKDRGVEDILFISMDGLTGLKEAISVVYPATITQRCIVHLSRNLYGICPKKEAKEIIQEFKKIYKSSDKTTAEFNYNSFVEKYANKNNIVKKVQDCMPHIYQIMEYPAEIRQIIYTTNPIESVNSTLRKVTNGKGSFPSDESVIKVLYLRIQELEKKWTKAIPNWSIVLSQLCDLFGDRITKHI